MTVFRLSFVGLLLAGSALAQNASNPTVQSLTITQTPSGMNSAVRLGDLQAGLASLATVARSGSYADLLNKPTIPAAPGVATGSVAGLMKPGAGLTVQSDGTVAVDSAAPVALTGNVLSTDTFLLQRGSTVYSVSPAQIPSSLLSSTQGGSQTTAPTYANTFTTTLSATSGTVGTALTVTETPGSGGWPAVAVAPSSTLAGTFSPTSTTPTAGSATPLTFQFTPSAAGTGTITASASGMTAGTAPSYTAAAAQQASGRPSLALTSATYSAGQFGQALSGGSGTAPVPIPSSPVFTMELSFKIPSGNSNGVKTFYSSADGIVKAFVDGGTVFFDADGKRFLQAGYSGDQWHHIAYVSDASESKVYFDGVEANQYYNNTSMGNSAYVISASGGVAPDNTPGVGSVDEVRISNVRRYSANFTPPTAAFVADASTLALWHLNGDGASE